MKTLFRSVAAGLLVIRRLFVFIGAHDCYRNLASSKVTKDQDRKKLPPALPVLNAFRAHPEKLNRHSRLRTARFSVRPLPAFLFRFN